MNREKLVIMKLMAETERYRTALTHINTLCETPGMDAEYIILSIQVLASNGLSILTGVDIGTDDKTILTTMRIDEHGNFHVTDIDEMVVDQSSVLENAVKEAMRLADKSKLIDREKVIGQHVLRALKG